jgi:PAS domain S-box-containing protein
MVKEGDNCAITATPLSDSARLQAAILVAQLGTFEWNVRTDGFTLDKRAREIFGFESDQGNSVEGILARLHPADLKAFRSRTTSAIEAGERFDCEFRVCLPDGSIRQVASAGETTAGADGRTEKVFGVFADVTARQEADRALRESEAKFKTIANAMPQMVWSTLPDGFHDYYNRQWYDFTGVPPGTTDGENWNGVFHPDDQGGAWRVWRHSLETGQPYEIQYRLRHRSGQYRWVLGRALPVRDEAGTIIRWMGTCTDIHDQRTAQEELLAANRRKDEFLAMLAHELRNPLAPIGTAAHLLKLAPGDPQRVGRASDIITRQVKHMITLVDDLLDVSRVTRGLVELRHDVVDLKAVLGSALEQARPLIEERGHELTRRVATVPVSVQGDRARLVQIVSNLLNNAAKYTPPGGRIDLALDVSDTTAAISVTDSGIGIEPGLLPHVFELFTQGERTPDRAQGGLGLGLSLVKNLSEMHGGAVRAHSEGLGKGSRFTVELPLMARQPSAGRELQDELSTAPKKNLNVLVVDDNVDAAESLAVFLETEGHHVQLATEPYDALKKAAQSPPEVCILDLGLPRMDGYELARRLRHELPSGDRATFIALTGYGTEQDRIRSSAAGFHHHCVKPVDLGQLLDILQQVPTEN